MFKRDFDMIKLDCNDPSADGDDRQESHLKFVVLGAAFASAQKWLIALSHAERAIAIIDRSKRLRDPIKVRFTGHKGSLKSHMSGREAYFLAAFSRRLLARDGGELCRSMDMLVMAEEALKEDHAAGTAKGVTEARFINERLAIALSRYYLARRANADNLNDDLAHDCFAAAEPVVDMFRKGSGVHGIQLRKITTVGLATNIVQVFVIAQFRKLRGRDDVGRCPVAHDEVVSAVRCIGELTNVSGGSADRITATKLISSYFIAGRLLTEESGGASLLNQLELLLKDLREAAATEYDAWSFAALLQFAREVCSTSGD